MGHAENLLKSRKNKPIADKLNSVKLNKTRKKYSMNITRKHKKT